MDDTTVQDETLEVENEPEVTTEPEVETAEPTQISIEEFNELKKKAEIADNQKIRAEKAEREKKELAAKLSKPQDKPDALSFIKLGKKLESYSDEEIDFAVEHAKSKDPDAILKALDDEMVQLAIHAKREKVEKEKAALMPSNPQSDTEAPSSLEEKLSKASLEEKEQILAEQFGYNVVPKRRDDTVYRRAQ